MESAAMAIRPLSGELKISEGEIKQRLRQSWVEVQNGLHADQLYIDTGKDIDSGIAAVRRIVSNLYHHSGFRWQVRVFCVAAETGVRVFAFYKHWEGAEFLDALRPESDKHYDRLSALEMASHLWQRENAYYFREVTDTEVKELESLAGHPSFTVSSYAADILTKLGRPTVPTVMGRMMQYGRQSDQKVRELRGDNSPKFEDRIDVSAYNFFEIVHPSYSKQTVATASFIQRYGDREQLKRRPQFIDVGSGPGLPLLMLLEMLPHLKATAIEPSEIAYNYLCRNLKLFGRTQAFPMREDFLKLPEGERHPLIVSTGSSHHFNTHFFFQKAQRLLAEGGLLIVADELIGRYSNVQERKLNLIRHHTQYILAVMHDITFSERLNEHEQRLVQGFNQVVPKAAYFALIGDLPQAEQLCRLLLKQTESLPLDDHTSDKNLAFYRLALLELEALVAGLDYEVEQKTYAERMLQMAALSGFRLLDHERVYATHGHGQWDAGTHVFAFGKR